MSGNGSRARRVAATRRAYADVYRLRGSEMPPPPFGNERQDRIYTQQYAKYRRSYWHMERMHAELAEVYGYTPTPRCCLTPEISRPWGGMNELLGRNAREKS